MPSSLRKGGSRLYLQPEATTRTSQGRRTPLDSTAHRSSIFSMESIMQVSFPSYDSRK